MVKATKRFQSPFGADLFQTIDVVIAETGE